MKRFTFSLEGVLGAKRSQEDAAKSDLALLQSQKDRIDALAAHLDQLRLEQDRQLGQAFYGALTPAAAVAVLRYTADLGDQIAAKRRDADAVREKIVAQRDRLLGLMKERKCFETLRERRLSEHRVMAQRKRYEAIDDMIAAQRKDIPHG